MPANAHDDSTGTVEAAEYARSFLPDDAHDTSITAIRYHYYLAASEGSVYDAAEPRYFYLAIVSPKGQPTWEEELAAPTPDGDRDRWSGYSYMYTTTYEDEIAPIVLHGIESLSDHFDGQEFGFRLIVEAGQSYWLLGKQGDRVAGVRLALPPGSPAVADTVYSEEVLRRLIEQEL